MNTSEKLLVIRDPALKQDKKKSFESCLNCKYDSFMYEGVFPITSLDWVLNFVKKFFYTKKTSANVLQIKRVSHTTTMEKYY